MLSSTRADNSKVKNFFQKGKGKESGRYKGFRACWVEGGGGWWHQRHLHLAHDHWSPQCSQNEHDTIEWAIKNEAMIMLAHYSSSSVIWLSRSSKGTYSVAIYRCTLYQANTILKTSTIMQFCQGKAYIKNSNNKMKLTKCGCVPSYQHPG